VITAASIAVGWTELWVVALVIAERRGSQRGVWIAKPLASLGFVACALAQGALASSYGMTVLAGLCACALGDVLLIPRGAGKAFLAGMGSFALGHAAYALAFARLGQARTAGLIALVVMAQVAIATLRWLGPRLPAEMRLPIRAYIVIISAMVVLAVGASAASERWMIGAGAVLFAVSDLSVARDRFVQPGFVNVLWGLPLYYLAQLLLAVSVAVQA
jgi:uncharacterized membrane protein YhhN